MGQGTQTEEAGENIDAEDEDYEEDAEFELDDISNEFSLILYCL